MPRDLVERRYFISTIKSNRISTVKSSFLSTSGSNTSAVYEAPSPSYSSAEGFTSSINLPPSLLALGLWDSNPLFCTDQSLQYWGSILGGFVELFLPSAVSCIFAYAFPSFHYRYKPSRCFSNISYLYSGKTGRKVCSRPWQFGLPSKRCNGRNVCQICQSLYSLS